MATLTVWKFDSPGGAGNALALLERMQKEELVQVNDAAYVYWEAGKKKPKTQQAHKLTSAGALGGSFWGFLFGLIFFIPLLRFVDGHPGPAVRPARSPTKAAGDHAAVWEPNLVGASPAEGDRLAHPP